GGEPARLTLSEWKEAEDGAWVDSELTEKITNPFEKNLLRGAMLAYMTGKAAPSPFSRLTFSSFLLPCVAAVEIFLLWPSRSSSVF
ncbi:hypothetical protein RRG08_057495, partial [Elysia crispata]